MTVVGIRLAVGKCLVQVEQRQAIGTVTDHRYGWSLQGGQEIRLHGANGGQRLCIGIINQVSADETDVGKHASVADIRSQLRVTTPISDPVGSLDVSIAYSQWQIPAT